MFIVHKIYQSIKKEEIKNQYKKKGLNLFKRLLSLIRRIKEDDDIDLVKKKVMGYTPFIKKFLMGPMNGTKFLKIVGLKKKENIFQKYLYSEDNYIFHQPSLFKYHSIVLDPSFEAIPNISPSFRLNNYPDLEYIDTWIKSPQGVMDKEIAEEYLTVHTFNHDKLSDYLSKEYGLPFRNFIFKPYDMYRLYEFELSGKIYLQGVKKDNKFYYNVISNNKKELYNYNKKRINNFWSLLFGRDIYNY